MKTIFKKVMAAVTTAAMVVTLLVGVSVSTDVKAESDNLVAQGTWSFYAANYSWRAVMPEPYDQATLTSLRTDSEDLSSKCTFETYKKYDDKGQPLKGTLWGDDIIFSDAMDFSTDVPSYGFVANINSWGWAAEYNNPDDPGEMTGDAPYTLSGAVTVPVQKGKIYALRLDLSASCGSDNGTQVPKMFTVNITDDAGTVLDTQKVTVPYGGTSSYYMEMASLGSTTLTVTVCYGCHFYSGEGTNGFGQVTVSNASVTYLSEDDTYEDLQPDVPTVPSGSNDTTTAAPTVNNNNNNNNNTTTVAPTTKAPTVKKLAKVKKVKAKNNKKKALTITWRKVTNAKKYQVKVGTKSYNTSKTKLVVKKLKKGKKYTVRVRAKASGYKTGAWSAKVKVKIKK